MYRSALKHKELHTSWGVCPNSGAAGPSTGGCLSTGIPTAHKQLHCVVPDWAVLVPSARAAQLEVQLKNVMSSESLKRGQSHIRI